MCCESNTVEAVQEIRSDPPPREQTSQQHCQNLYDCWFFYPNSTGHHGEGAWAGKRCGRLRAYIIRKIYLYWWPGNAVRPPAFVAARPCSVEANGTE